MNSISFKKIIPFCILAATLILILMICFFTNRAKTHDFTLPTESPRTYYLESPTERQKFERLLSVTLYGDGTANLATPPISSYILPKCTTSIVDGELLIHAVIETEFDEGFFGLKNGDVIAKFLIIDNDTLIFQTSTVPLFGDYEARYIYASSPPSIQ